jgi:hypothetical protein
MGSRVLSCPSVEASGSWRDCDNLVDRAALGAMACLRKVRHANEKILVAYANYVAISESCLCSIAEYSPVTEQGLPQKILKNVRFLRRFLGRSREKNIVSAGKFLALTGRPAIGPALKEKRPQPVGGWGRFLVRVHPRTGCGTLPIRPV